LKQQDGKLLNQQLSFSKGFSAQEHFTASQCTYAAISVNKRKQKKKTPTTPNSLNTLLWYLKTQPEATFIVLLHSALSLLHY